MRGHCDNAFYQVILDNASAYFALAARLRGQRAVGKHKADFPIGRKMINHVLNPRVIGVPGGRDAVFPTLIVFELVLSPAGQIKRRVRHNEVRL